MIRSSPLIKTFWKNTVRIFPALILAAVLVTVPLWSGGCGKSSSSDKPDTKANRSSTQERFALKNIYNKSYKWSDFLGHPFIVNFWATWCGPCRREIPGMIKVYDDYQSRGLKIVAISVDDARTLARVPAFIDAYHIPWIVLYGNEQVAREFNLGPNIPVTIFFDAQGHEVSRFVGSQPESVFRQELEKLYSQSPQA
jgi:thiol-disulfide isomerase/thioredoxin